MNEQGHRSKPLILIRNLTSFRFSFLTFVAPCQTWATVSTYLSQPRVFVPLVSTSALQFLSSLKISCLHLANEPGYLRLIFFLIFFSCSLSPHLTRATYVALAITVDALLLGSLAYQAYVMREKRIPIDQRTISTVAVGLGALFSLEA